MDRAPPADVSVPTGHRAGQPGRGPARARGSSRPPDARRWWRQPLPWSCNRFPKLCYPRIVHYGGAPDVLTEDDREVPEVKLG